MATGVILYPLFSEYECSVALSVLKQANQPIITIGAYEGLIMGESDLNVQPDVTLDNVDINQLDSLLFSGCMDIETLIHHDRLYDFIQRVAANDVKIGAISSSPFLLAKAGMLGNRRFTIGMNEEDRDRHGVFIEENYSDDLVVEDRNIITARGRGFIEFGIKFGHLLGLEFDERWYR